MKNEIVGPARPDQTSGSHRRLLGWLGAAAMFAAIVTVVVVTRVGDSSSGAAMAQADSVADTWVPSPDEQARLIEGQMESGWLPYGGDDALKPGTPPPDLWGWIRYGESVEPGKSPVYDNPGGTVIGFAYAQLGFVALADDGAFDAHAARVERYTCDQYTDATCVIPETEGLPPQK